jgi:hypothetical protein
LLKKDSIWEILELKSGLGGVTSISTVLLAIPPKESITLIIIKTF